MLLLQGNPRLMICFSAAMEKTTTQEKLLWRRKTLRFPRATQRRNLHLEWDVREMGVFHQHRLYMQRLRLS